VAKIDELDVGAFVRRLHSLVTKEEDCRMVWFLGAGCSVSSGIPTAAGLVDRWLPELHQSVTGGRIELQPWVAGEFGDLAGDLTSIYGTVIGRLFPTPRERQREIERLTGEKDPEIGYALMAVLMATPTIGPRLNVILSTNFDDLAQDALYILTRQKPLVVAHDSLAPYARHSRNRPLIVKVHGDAQLAPRNTPDETSAVGPQMAAALGAVLAGSGIVFCGYGGNDGSIAELLRSLPPNTLEWGTYWVGNEFPHGPVGEVLRERSEATFLVRHRDFDSLMLRVAEEFNLDFPPLVDRFKKLEDSYGRSLKRQTVRETTSDLGDPEVPNASQEAASNAASRMSGTLEAYRLMDEAQALVNDPERADLLFKQAVAAAENNAVILGAYARFLHEVRRDADQAEEYYRRALDADPTNAIDLGNYALFLHEVRKDPDRAEDYYRRALDADPTQANTLGNYALFLANVRKDPDRAEDYYRRALDADPTDANNVGNYAVFVANVRKDPDRAEDYYRQALDADPTHANTLGNYAGLLFAQGQDARALEMVVRARNEAPPEPLQLELAFYRYAHVPEDRDSSLADLRRLIADGNRSPGFDLSANVERARTSGHPNPDLLADLAGVIADQAPASVLDQYPEWHPPNA
jgi:protein O-mannosyl-transferase